MTEMFFASQNGRDIPKEDKIFGISNRAKAMIAEKGRENVVNATIGALLDDDGKLMVLSSVSDVFKSLDMADCAEYAPIAGTPGFRKAVKKVCSEAMSQSVSPRQSLLPAEQALLKMQFQIIQASEIKFSQRTGIGVRTRR